MPMNGAYGGGGQLFISGIAYAGHGADIAGFYYNCKTCMVVQVLLLS